MTAHLYIGSHTVTLQEWYRVKARARQRHQRFVRVRRLVWASLLAVVLYLAVSARTNAQEAYTADDTLAAIEQYSVEIGVPSALLYRIVSCETGGTFSPSSVGRQGELGAVQLHPRGRLPHFLALGYTDAFSPWQAVRYLAQEISFGRGAAWSCR